MLIQIRVSDKQHEAIKAKSKENGFDTISEYGRYVLLNAKVSMTVPKKGK